MRRTLLLLLLLPTLAYAQTQRRAIETNLATAVAIEGVKGKSLAERMKELGVPAVSYAVVEDGKIVLAAAYGMADLASGRAATTSTLFQAASLSKPVAALGVMELVERGKLRLDEPVNTILRSWKLPENELTAVTPVTLRLLLSHSAGTTVHGFPGYERTAQRPTVNQVLDGKAPANTKAVVVDLAPNTKFRYSGGGITVVQAAVADHTNTDFPTFMRRTVFQPLGMTRSTYEQPLPASRRAEAATAYRLGQNEVEGKWHVYPEMAAAGLWTTPSDLAKVIIEMQNALAGKPTKLLSIDAARHMVTPRFNLSPDTFIGLGFFIEQRGDARYFTHGGSNEGFRCVFMGSVDGSKGAVVMTSSDTGSRLMNVVLNTIAREYDWPGFDTTPLKTTTLSDADAERYAGRFELESKEVVAIRRDGGRLGIIDLTTGWQPLYPLADGTLARSDRNLRYALTADGITLIQNPTSSEPKRLLARRLPADAAPTGDELLAAGRIEEAKTAYRALFREKPASLPEPALNNAGYGFLNAGLVDQAVAILELNTEFYPTSSNTYDSLADALIAAGQTDRAIVAYEELLRRLDADPTPSADIKELLRHNAKKRIERLRVKK